MRLLGFTLNIPGCAVGVAKINKGSAVIAGFTKFPKLLVGILSVSSLVLCSRFSGYMTSVVCEVS